MSGDGCTPALSGQLFFVGEEESMRVLKKLNDLLIYAFTFMGGITLTLMMVIACANMIMRLAGRPISATYELVGYLGALTVALPLAYAQLKKSHIGVDILTSRFPQGVRRVISGVGLLLGMLFFVVAAWQVGAYGETLRQVGEVSGTMRLPFYPFVFGVAASCGLITLCMLVDFLSLIVPSEQQTE